MTTGELEERRAKRRRYMAEYRARNPERRQLAVQKYKEKNRAALTEKRRAYRERRAEYMRSYQREYRKTHRAQINEYHAAWKKSPTGRISRRSYQLRYRSKQKVKDLSGAALCSMIEQFVPHGLLLDLRSEIVAETAIALLTGECLIKNIQAKTKQALQAHHRMFSKFGPVSLDSARFDDGSGTLHDTVSVGLWD